MDRMSSRTLKLAGINASYQRLLSKIAQCERLRWSAMDQQFEQPHHPIELQCGCLGSLGTRADLPMHP